MGHGPTKKSSMLSYERYEGEGEEGSEVSHNDAGACRSRESIGDSYTDEEANDRNDSGAYDDGFKRFKHAHCSESREHDEA